MRGIELVFPRLVEGREPEEGGAVVQGVTNPPVHESIHVLDRRNGTVSVTFASKGIISGHAAVVSSFTRPSYLGDDLRGICHGSYCAGIGRFQRDVLAMPEGVCPAR